ncbi:RING finger protein 150 [Salminus brasiliensis]|uniref:RING finger protein 150 n=1 Tax=Salminus brasiliensis TaxID=930266 RepID=UPI003B83817E
MAAAACARLLALLPALCLALAAADREEWYTAFVNVTYVDPATARVRTERSECGRYGEQSPKREARGLLAASLSPRERQACRPGTRFAVPERAGAWIALVARGNCTFAEKIRHAAGQNASAVVVMNVGATNGNETITMPHLGTGWPRAAFSRHFLPEKLQVIWAAVVSNLEWTMKPSFGLPNECLHPEEFPRRDLVSPTGPPDV